jgi:hypothetical protein
MRHRRSWSGAGRPFWACAHDREQHLLAVRALFSLARGTAISIGPNVPDDRGDSHQLIITIIAAMLFGIR